MEEELNRLRLLLADSRKLVACVKIRNSPTPGVVAIARQLIRDLLQRADEIRRSHLPAATADENRALLMITLAAEDAWVALECQQRAVGPSR